MLLYAGAPSPLGCWPFSTRIGKAYKNLLSMFVIFLHATLCKFEKYILQNYENELILKRRVEIQANFSWVYLLAMRALSLASDLSNQIWLADFERILCNSPKRPPWHCPIWGNEKRGKMRHKNTNRVTRQNSV